MNITKKSIKEDLQWYIEDIQDSIRCECYYVAYDTAIELKGLIFWAYSKRFFNIFERDEWLDIVYQLISESRILIIQHYE